MLLSYLSPQKIFLSFVYNLICLVVEVIYYLFLVKLYWYRAAWSGSSYMYQASYDTHTHTFTFCLKYKGKLLLVKPKFH